MKAVIGRKIGMTQVFTEAGTATAVTLVKVEPNVVAQVKTGTKDGYEAIQVGLSKKTKAGKSTLGHLKASGLKNAVLREFRSEPTAEGEAALKAGDKLDVSQFEAGEAVTITAVSKGKGFAGTIKRHNFHRGPKSHGGMSYRRPGSIGSMYPQHVMKGKRMAGRMGQDTVTLKKVQVFDVNAEDGILALKGPLPGPNKGIVIIKG